VTQRTESAEIRKYLERLFPITRSLTGSGNRETLRIISEIVPIEIVEYPSGQEVFDWTIPDEWIIRDAWIKNSAGEKIVDFKKNNLHLVSYSTPVDQKFHFRELQKHLHFLPSQPDAIPYRTSYYKRQWGFCVTQRQYQQIEAEADELEVFIDSEFDAEGSLSIGELVIEGHSSEEYVVSTYICHPSMVNDNLSGMLVAAFMAKEKWEGEKPEKTWRFVFAPETIGIIAYLFNNKEKAKQISGGFIVTCCGGPGQFGYKKTFIGDHLIDRAVMAVFNEADIDPIIYSFTPEGSDERQFSSPGFRIPVASITKDKYHEFSEYHTSLDNLEFAVPSQIVKTLNIYLNISRVVDFNKKIRSKVPYCEAQLGKRGLYPETGGGFRQVGGSHVSTLQRQVELDISTLNWVLFLADGDHDLLDISKKSGKTTEEIFRTAKILLAHNLIEGVET